jgi:hypothetical protein
MDQLAFEFPLKLQNSILKSLRIISCVKRGLFLNFFINVLSLKILPWIFLRLYTRFLSILIDLIWFSKVDVCATDNSPKPYRSQRFEEQFQTCLDMPNFRHYLWLICMYLKGEKYNYRVYSPKSLIKKISPKNWPKIAF